MDRVTIVVKNSAAVLLVMAYCGMVMCELEGTKGAVTSMSKRACLVLRFLFE